MKQDPRLNSTEKIVPPAPLPYISRKALSRVTNPLPVPTACPYCGGPIELVSHMDVYGREYGNWPYVYRCSPCDAHVGLHPDTDIPLGTLANSELRSERAKQKAHFERLWKSGKMTRTGAYRWLAVQMNLSPDDCHWGIFTLEQCRMAGALCQLKANNEIPGQHSGDEKGGST